PNALEKLYLPWLPELKGPDSDHCGLAQPVTVSARVAAGGYRLTSTRPVTVYQFSALEYTEGGGPPGKDWSSCPGNEICEIYGVPIGCFSFSNDASLLLPKAALTGNYRITGYPGQQFLDTGTGPTFAVTGVEDGTHVSLFLSATGSI